jgi:hypothetical protein
MDTQEELKKQIRKEMEELGYNPIPDMEKMEVVDITTLNYQGRMAYYQNLNKKALIKEFANHFKTTIPMDAEILKKINEYGNN